MGFLQSAINQVGRDLGRVASNAVFKDSHAIPIRRAKSYNSSTSNQRPAQPKAQPIQQVKDDFEKAINFKTGYKPGTLVSKLGGAFIVIKNEARGFVEDGYLDKEESEQLFDMIKDFNEKCRDIEDVISFTEDKNAKEYKQLENIIISLREVFAEVLEVSAKACKKQAVEYEKEGEALKPTNFFRYVGLHLIWMPRYAKGGEMNIGKAVLANVLDVFGSFIVMGIFETGFAYFFIRGILLLTGLVTYPSEVKNTKQAKDDFTILAKQERNRAKAYEALIKENTED